MAFSARSILAASVMGAAGGAYGAPPKNVIMFVGDGMGHEHIKAAGYYFNGAVGQFSFEQLDQFAWMEHNSSNGDVTDSAASATALATGFKVDNDVVSVALASGTDPRSATPSDGRDLPTILEQFAQAGRSTGVVTNSFVTDATPAAFAAHVPTRGFTNGILSDLLTQVRPNVIFGGRTAGVGSAIFSSRGYSVATNRQELNAIASTDTHAAALFGSGELDFAYDYSVGSTNFYDTNPFLHEMTGKAIDQLSTNPNGFFLMVESDLTDAAGHLAVAGTNKLERGIFEVRELSRAVQRAIDFAANNPETLIIVTADHETGGITAGQNNGAGAWPGAVSGDTRHNATWVPTYASGPNAGHFRGIIDNTDVSRLAMTSVAEPDQPTFVRVFQQGLNGYSGVTDTQVQAAAPAQSFGTAVLLSADADEDPANTLAEAAPVQLAIRFGDLFDPAAIPTGATVVSAKLSLFTGSGSSDGTTGRLSIHRLLTGFDDSTTWNSAGNASGNGFSLNSAGTQDDDYLAAAEYVFPAPTNNAVADFDVTESIAAWMASHAAGTDTNFGWVIFNNGTNGWVLNASESGPLARPTLEISFIVPEPSGALCIALPLLARRRRRC